MKRCQKCNFQNENLKDYCWRCGTDLYDLPQTYFNFQTSRPTESFRIAPPSNYGAGNETQTFVAYRNNFIPNYGRAASSGNKTLMILGSVFALFLMFAVSGAATVYAVFYVPKPNPVKPSTVQVNEPEKVEKPEKTEETENKESKPVEITTDKPKTTNKTTPAARFERMWVDYNVKEKGRLGMRIHVRFFVYDLKGVDSYLAIYFEKENGSKLMTKNRNYASKDGQVAVYRSLKPAYEETVYDDISLFIPYDEFRLARGKYNLKMDADVIYQNGDLVQHLNYYNFEYEKY